MLKALNESTARQARQDTETRQALMLAKSALFGYALAYPDGPGPRPMEKGPGYLPCPDHVPAGTPGSADNVPDCVVGKETGRFPWRTLGMGEILDRAGAPLWYAVSNSHRSSSSAGLNSTTTGTLTVDGSADDIVAVIIAPGAALAGQSRTTANAYDASVYLEDDNASLGDSSFVSTAGGEFNDVVVRITRGELMAQVERTVLNEIANALDNYFNDPDADDDTNGDDPDCGADADCDDGYPWLADFADPSARVYIGAVDNFGGGDVSFGHLPLMQRGVPVNADFLATWDIDTEGTYSVGPNPPVAPEAPVEDCLRNDACTQNYDVWFYFWFISVPYSFTAGVNGAPGGLWDQGTCTLAANNLQDIACTAQMDFTVGSFSPWARTIRRIYQLTLVGNATEIDAPTATTKRALRISEINSWSGQPATLTVTDYELPDVVNPIGSATLEFTTIVPGDNLTLSNVPFDLEVSPDDAVDHTVSPGELPNWFFAEGWDQLILVHYARAESPGDTDLTCVDDSTCLTVNVTRLGSATTAIDTEVRGVVLIAGRDLSSNRHSATRADYLEGNNATVDTLTYDKKQVTAAFNDQLVTLPLYRP